MIAVLLSWIVIGSILLSFGCILEHSYNQLCKKNEKYNLIDKVLLGLCSLIIPLSIWSLWLPSDYIFLIICIIISGVYWIMNTEKRRQLIQDIKNKLIALSTKERFIIIAFFILILSGSLWVQGVFDSVYYHHQNIRWNEEFAVVPGLGNLEDRFAFNSNYLLLSAIFTFRFIAGDALYTINPLFFVLIWCWVLYELFKSKYDVKTYSIFISFALFYLISLIFIYDTSTDLLPNLLAFYIIAKVIIKPESIKENKLLFFIIPAFMITCKISVFPFCIFTLYIFFILIKQKQYKNLLFLVILSSVIVIPWLIRNIIISGYLIYPMCEIDLFSFDWKIPHEVAIKSKDYILFVGQEFFTFITTTPLKTYRDPFWVNILTLIIYGFSLLSFITIIYNTVVKRKKTPLSYILAASALILILIVWYINGPDMRFISGISTIFLSLTAAFIFFDKKKFHTKYLSIISIIILLMSAYIWNGRELYRGYITVKEAETKIPAPYYKILIKPYTQEWLSLNSVTFKDHITTYPLNNNININICNLGATYDIIPTIATKDVRGIFINEECIEARGYSLQEGFRSKRECY